MTADSSLSSEHMTTVTNSPELLSPSSPLSLAPLPSLRKSLSVDSFINYRPLPDQSTRPNRGNTMSATANPLVDDVYGNYNRQSAACRDPDSAQQQAGPSRSRGTSISTTTGDEYDSSLLDDSDVERPEDRINVMRKGKVSWRRQPQAEELALPSRLTTVSSSPSMGRPPPPIVPERTSSLGQHRLMKQRSLISINTQVPPVWHLVRSFRHLLTVVCSPQPSPMLLWSW